MDAQHTAEARIELVERRLTALQEAGVDTAGLASRLDVARAALAQGRPGEVPAICEDLLADARRLAEGGISAPRASRPVRTERAERSDRLRAVVAPEPPAAITPPPVDDLPLQIARVVSPQMDALEARLQERIAGIAPLVESLKTQVQEQPGLDMAALEHAIERSVSPLLESLQQQVAERFARLSASETKVFAKPGIDAEQVQAALGDMREEMASRLADLGQKLAPPDAGERLLQAVDQRLETALEEVRTDMENRMAGLAAALPTPNTDTRLTDLFDRRMEARLAAVTEHTAMAIEALRSELHDQPITTPATVRVHQALAQAMPEATASAVDQALAPLESRLETRLTEMAETIGALEARIRDTQEAAQDAGALAERLGSLEERLDQRVEEAVGGHLTSVITDSLKSLDATVAATVRELVGEALTSRPVADSTAIQAKITEDLRADLDFQMEQMAAEKGWVSINDVRAEVAQRHSALDPAVSNQSPASFARLEAALVEFVRQTQSQQQQFLAVLHDKVERHTEVLVEKAVTGALVRDPLAAPASPSSEAISAPPQQNALDPLLPDDSLIGGPGFPEIIHSTVMLDALARGSSSSSFAHPHTAEAAQDPDLPPSDDLDALSPSAQSSTLRDSQAAIPALSPEDAEILKTLTGIEHRPATPAATVRTEAIMGAPREDAPEVPLATDPPNHDEPITATQVATAADENLSSEVMELEAITDLQPAPAAMSGLDDHETATFDSAATRSRLDALPDQVATEAEPTIPLEEERQEETAEATSEIPPEEPPLADAPAPLAMVETAATASDIPTAPVAATPPTTRRTPSDLESALRRMISQEIERQVGAGLPSLTAAVRGAVADAMERHRADEADHLQDRVQASVQQELAQRTSDPAKDLAALAEVLRNQAQRATGPGDLREAVMTLLHDPQIRQTVLEIVAVEAIANPGPLAEMTGLRAFIRQEVRQAGTAQGNDLPDEALAIT